MPRCLSLVWVLTCCTAVATAAEPLIWVEGEQAVKKQLVDNAPMNDVNPDALSGGKWICSFSHPGEPTGSGEYPIEAPTAGKYRVWVRAMPGSGMAYRVDGGKDAVDVAVDKGQDPIAISADANPYWPGQASWFDAGTVELTQGKHTLTWYLGGLKSPDRYAGMDCFVLTTGSFVPNGKYKPGEKSPQPQPAFRPGQAWDFQPKPDKFDPAAVLDLRSLNEKTAGEHGFIKQSADGDSFVRGDGQPIRFWAAGLRTGQRDMKELRRQARFLAKHGVNAIRVFAMLPPKGEHSKITDVDEGDLDSLFMTEAAMKAEGIYTFTGAYWACSTPLQKSWDVTDPGRGQCEDLVYFDPKFQVGYKAWMKALCAEESLYGPADRRRSGRGHYPIAERRLSHLVGNHGPEGRRPETVPGPVRGLPHQEARLAGEDPRRLAELRGHQDARQRRLGGRIARHAQYLGFQPRHHHPLCGDSRIQGPAGRSDGVPGPRLAPLQSRHGRVSPQGPGLQAAHQRRQLADRGPCDDPGRRILGRQRLGRPRATSIRAACTRAAATAGWSFPATSTPTRRCSSALCKCRPT